MVESPERVGRYAVDRALGSGGMGEVYLAHSPAGDPVALKVIRSDRLDPVTRARFEKESLIARTVVGTNRVARFLDADPYADRPWLAMEYIPGETLFTHVEEHGRLSAPLVASLGALLAEGLAAVHASGLLHRDLKPQNVVLGEYGPVLIDFGLAALLDPTADTLSQSGMIIGTVRSMPPEQASGRGRGNEAADVYGLGAVLLYAATRHHPYDGERWEAIVAQVTSPEVPPDLSGLPAALQPLIVQMLAHDPGARPALDAVMLSCAAILAAGGTTPMAARLALIARTFREHPSLPVPSSDLISKLHGIDDSEFSPLDSPSAAAESADGQREDEPEERDAAPEVPLRRGRQPASERIADELRARYAAQARL